MITRPRPDKPGGNHPGARVGASNFAGTDPSGGIITGMLIVIFRMTSLRSSSTGSCILPPHSPGGYIYPLHQPVNPLYPITIDPMDGYVFVNIPFYVLIMHPCLPYNRLKVLVPFHIAAACQGLDFTAKAKDKTG